MRKMGYAATASQPLRPRCKLVLPERATQLVEASVASGPWPNSTTLRHKNKYTMHEEQTRPFRLVAGVFPPSFAQPCPIYIPFSVQICFDPSLPPHPHVVESARSKEHVRANRPSKNALGRSTRAHLPFLRTYHYSSLF